MARKLGIVFIVFFSLLLTVELLLQDFFVRWALIVTTICTSVFVPFGAALISINAPAAKRARVKNIYLLSSLLLILMALVSMRFDLPGARVELITGCLFYTFAYGPLELVHKYQKWLPYSRTKLESILLSSVNFVGFGMFVIGWLFKFQKWPWADNMVVSGSVVLILGMIAWNFKFTKEVVRRKEAETQIKEQFEEIRASISYAKRIQAAILPPAELIKKHLPDSFVLYKPKDIVAGDFYWLEPSGNKVFFAVADCTGHGVPGAMVSLVCNNGLNRSVREHGLSEPGKILERTREIVIAEFEKSEEEVKDGMDIALCSLEGTTLQYAGAHNPLWIVRGNECLETKANKQPIGKFDKQLPFTTHTIRLQKGDTVYIFSDGYADQFGGENGKKFKAAKMKELLVSVKNEPMEEQKRQIGQAFEKWKGKLEQVDDVCVIGVRI